MSVASEVIKYATLPRILPRISGLVVSGFSHLAFFIAVVYQNAGLLPTGNIFLNPKNFGRYGIRHVIAAASNNLVISWNNLDKVIIFFTILIGLCLLLLQIVLLALSLVAMSAFAAAGPNWEDTFINTPFGPDQDIALIVLDYVFGANNFLGTSGFFESCYSNLAVDCLNMRGQIIPSPTAWPLPFHIALHELFLFYNLGIAFVSGVVILYSIVAIIGETITSGTPFGRRFNKAWFVPRLIFFFAMIAPMSLVGPNVGISASQFVALGAAKLGSNMATNAWSTFADSINDAYAADGISTALGDQNSLIAMPTIPSLGKLSSFMYLVRVCMYAEKILNNVDVRPYLVREVNADPLMLANDYMVANFDPTFFNLTFWPYFGANIAGMINIAAPKFADAVGFSRNGNVILRFGELNLPDAVSAAQPFSDLGAIKGAHDTELGFVKPYCGELTFDISAIPVSSLAAPPATESDPVVTGFVMGVDRLGIQENYFVSIYDYLADDPTYEKTALCLVQSFLPFDHSPSCVDQDAVHSFNAGMWTNHLGPGAYPDVNAKTGLLTRELARNSINYYDAVNRLYMIGNFTVGNTVYSGITPEYNNSIIGYLRANYDFGIPNSVLARGWVGMSAYYNKIAELNGTIFSAVQNTPNISKYPMVMELVAEQHDKNDTNPSQTERFNPLLQNGKIAELPRSGDQYEASALYQAYNFWERDNLINAANREKTENPVIDAINALFGTHGLFDMLKNTDTHPLAQLSALGKAMLESSIRNVFIGSSLGLVSDVLKNGFSINLGPFPKIAGDMATKIGMMGITIGFVLYYVLPLLPFIYFFFAFGGWVKAVFEAVVAMPLWCLAHIKIDGQGLPGPWATNGYYLLFEIFLRPTLIVLGFIASITVFAALVKGLNTVYDGVVVNVAGYNMEESVYEGTKYTALNNTTISKLRGPIDQFLYTIIYAVLVYMIGLSCFKMIDQIPNAILRFMGVSVSTFRDKGADAGADLKEKLSRTASVTKNQLEGAVARIKGMGEGGWSERDEFLRQMAANKKQ